MRKIKVVVLLVQQLQHGFTKNAKVSPNLTVAHIVKRCSGVKCNMQLVCIAGYCVNGGLKLQKQFSTFVINYSPRYMGQTSF